MNSQGKGAEDVTRVLVVDDSRVCQNLIAAHLNRDPSIEVVGLASDAFEARDMIFSKKPDVLTLDLNMPHMAGLSFLENLMKHHPMPVVVLSSEIEEGCDVAIKALSIGAVDAVSKTTIWDHAPEDARSISRIVKSAATVRVRRVREGAPPERKIPVAKEEPAGSAARRALPPAAREAQVIAIGASTGGTRAIETLVKEANGELPPVLIAQHMPPGFTGAFAARLQLLGTLDVIESRGGEPLEKGRAYIAPGGHHLKVQRLHGHLVCALDDGPEENFQKPAVDVLFRSVAGTCGASAIGVVLTGMGLDGSKGLLDMMRSGAETIAQNEESCAVFGMPRAAIELGGVGEVLSLEEIAAYLARVRAEEAERTPVGAR